MILKRGWLGGETLEIGDFTILSTDFRHIYSNVQPLGLCEMRRSSRVIIGCKSFKSLARSLAAPKKNPNNMVHCSGGDLPSFSATVIYRPDLRLPSLIEEPAQLHLIYETADASRPNNPVPKPSLGHTRKIYVYSLSGDPFGHVAKDERPNLHRDDWRINQFKVCTLTHDPCRLSPAKMN